MKIYQLILLMLAVSSAAGLHAQEKAVVTQNRANVRGQAALFGEVITQLKKGDEVLVLEEIAVPKPKPNEPAKWIKIRMPENTPVWVFAAYISPDRTVNVKKLNLRAGPGENYSAVGRLEKGDKVKEIRVVEDWMEIETPEQAYAFLAADLIGKPEAAAAAAPKEEPKKETPAPAIAKTEPPPTAVPQPKVETPAPTPPPVVALPTEASVAPTKDVAEPVKQAAKTTAEPKKEEPVPAPAPITAATPKGEAKAPEKLPEVAPAPVASAKDEPLPRRVVRREGIVRTTTSIQAPTYFELVSPETKKTINYIHTERSGINIKEFRGKKITISGEEMIDPRWPKVPVIEVETLDYQP